MLTGVTVAAALLSTAHASTFTTDFAERLTDQEQRAAMKRVTCGMTNMHSSCNIQIRFT